MDHFEALFPGTAEAMRRLAKRRRRVINARLVVLRPFILCRGPWAALAA